MEQPIATRLAARETGIPERTLRNWITAGKLAATKGERGYLVRLSDVRRIAALTGRTPATEKPPEIERPHLADAVAAETGSALTVREQEQRVISAIQEAVQPLVEQIGGLREDLGRERALREAAEHEAERLRAEIERERERGRRGFWRRLFGGEE